MNATVADVAAPDETAARPARRRRWSGGSFLLAGLAVLNAALLASLLGRFVPDNTAEAAMQAQPSEYILMPSRPLGLNQDILYVLDTRNGNMTVVGYNQNGEAGGTMEFLPPIPLSQLFRR